MNHCFQQLGVCCWNDEMNQCEGGQQEVTHVHVSGERM